MGRCEWSLRTLAVVPVLTVVRVRAQRSDRGSSHRFQNGVDGMSPESSVRMQGHFFRFADVTLARWNMCAMGVVPIGHKLLGTRGPPELNYFCDVDVLKQTHPASCKLEMTQLNPTGELLACLRDALRTSHLRCSMACSPAARTTSSSTQFCCG